MGLAFRKTACNATRARWGWNSFNLLVEKLEGTVELQSGPGTAWRIEFHQLHYQERM